MTAPAAPAKKRRTAADVDADIETVRADRAKCLEQIEACLKNVTALRTRYSRSGDRIDQLLDERFRIKK